MSPRIATIAITITSSKSVKAREAGAAELVRQQRRMRHPSEKPRWPPLRPPAARVAWERVSDTKGGSIRVVLLAGRVDLGVGAVGRDGAAGLDVDPPGRAAQSGNEPELALVGADRQRRDRAQVRAVDE